MKATATIDAIDEQPLHPNDDPTVQAAREAWLAAIKAEEEARAQHESNHQRLHGSHDTTERLLAQAAAPSLLVSWLESKARAQEAERHYQQVHAEAMRPTTAYWKRRHQEAVRVLTDALQGPAFHANAAVLRIIDEAAAAGVPLAPTTSMPELAQPHLDFLVSQLHVNAGL